MISALDAFHGRRERKMSVDLPVWLSDLPALMRLIGMDMKHGYQRNDEGAIQDSVWLAERLAVFVSGSTDATDSLVVDFRTSPGSYTVLIDRDAALKFARLLIAAAKDGA